MKEYRINKKQSKQELIREYNKMARSANKQLYRLEQYSKEPGYENITSFAYAKALKGIQRKYGSDKIRFQLAGDNVDVRRLRGDINILTEFMNSPSRTKTGIKKIYQNKADSINETYGTFFTWDDMSNYYSAGLNMKLDSLYGSKTSLKFFGEFQKKDTKELENIYKSLNKNHKLKKYNNKEELIGNIMSHKNMSQRRMDDLI